MIRAYVFKTTDPGEKKPWAVEFYDPQRPGVKLYEGRAFGRWRKALNWADQAVREEVRR